MYVADHLLMNIEWLTANITAVGPPNRAVSTVSLGYFDVCRKIWAAFVAEESLCDLELTLQVLNTLGRISVCMGIERLCVNISSVRPPIWIKSAVFGLFLMFLPNLFFLCPGEPLCDLVTPIWALKPKLGSYNKNSVLDCCCNICWSPQRSRKCTFSGYLIF